VSWGVSDFLGGLNSRHVALATVLLVTQLVGLMLLLPVAVLHGGPGLEPAHVGFAVSGSVSGLIGIAALYRGMAVGSVSIVAPISATGAGIPVLFGLLRGEQATAIQMVGIGLALVGIVLASQARHAGPSKPQIVGPGVGLAVLAAFGFGGFFVLLHEASARDVLWAGVIQRLTGTIIMVLVTLWLRLDLVGARRRVGSLVVAGVLDTGANVLYALSSVTGLVSLAAVLASLYPVMTVVLARFVLHERLAPSQAVGVTCALAGVACIALQ
jgi:drug/metabolite transporter (DMT)-like permease